MIMMNINQLISEMDRTDEFKIALGLQWYLPRHLRINWTQIASHLGMIYPCASLEQPNL